MADVLAGFQIDRHERVGIQIITWTHAAIDVGRRIADDEVDALVRKVYRWVLPDRTAERFVRIAALGQRRLFRSNVAMQIEARRVMCRPNTNRIYRRRVERPDFSAGLRIKRLERAADAVFRTGQADQYLAIDRSRRSCHRITLERIGKLLAPHYRTGF